MEELVRAEQAASQKAKAKLLRQQIKEIDKRSFKLDDTIDMMVAKEARRILGRDASKKKVVKAMIAMKSKLLGDDLMMAGAEEEETKEPVELTKDMIDTVIEKMFDGERNELNKIAAKDFRSIFIEWFVFSIAKTHKLREEDQLMFGMSHVEAFIDIATRLPAEEVDLTSISLIWKLILQRAWAQFPEIPLEVTARTAKNIWTGVDIRLRTGDAV